MHSHTAVITSRLPHAATAFFALLLAFPASMPAAETRPNIVLIMADDMGYECVAANGGESYKTPHLDKLAASGMRFTHCYSQPICTPSRVQIMTGIYNSRNYIRFGILDPQATTFGHVLKQAGYKTCIAGKWQLLGGPQGPQHFGFDEHCLWQLIVRKSRYPNPLLEINGKIVDYTNGEYGPDVCSDFLCEFIERHQDQPFFAYYPMILPHWPFEPTPDSEDWNPQAEGVLRGHGQNKYFDDMVTYTDKMVGKIVATLDELGLRENTLVLFTGDNGTYTGITSKFKGQKYAGGKGSLKDNGTHVPMIANWPGMVPAGKVNENLIDFSDYLPTLAAIAGAKLPSDIEFDGHNFAPQLLGHPSEPRVWSYCWYFRNGKPGDAGGGETARTTRYKLYLSGEFFDLQNDPWEEQPLSVNKLDPEQQRIHERLAEVLEQHTRAGFYTEKTGNGNKKQ